LKGGEKKEKEEGAGRGLETLLQKKGGVACICPWPLRSSPRGRGPMRNSTARKEKTIGKETGERLSGRRSTR